MAETDEKKVLDGAESSEENKTPDEKQTAPPVIEVTDKGGGGTPGEQPGQKEAETPQTEAQGQEQGDKSPPLGAEAPPAPDVVKPAEQDKGRFML